MSPAVTTADPVLTRFALGRSNDGSQFGMFLQVFADGTVIDSEGVHHLRAADLRPIVETVQSGELYRVRGHCGAPSTDFIEYVHVVIYERRLGRLNAHSFSYSGNSQGCDQSIRHLHTILENLQAKLSRQPGTASPAVGVGSGTRAPSPVGPAPMSVPGASSSIPTGPAPAFGPAFGWPAGRSGRESGLGRRDPADPGRSVALIPSNSSVFPCRQARAEVVGRCLCDSPSGRLASTRVEWRIIIDFEPCRCSGGGGRRAPSRASESGRKWSAIN